MGAGEALLPTRGHPSHAGSADRLDCRRLRGSSTGAPAAQADGGVWRSLAARFVRDEEAAGSNPATPTRKYQVDGMITRHGDHAIDHSLAVRWRDRTPQPGTRRAGSAEDATVQGRWQSWIERFLSLSWPLPR